MSNTDSEEISIPVNLAASLRMRIQQVDQASHSLNAYVQGVADTLEVPEGFQLDREQMKFVNPAKDNGE